MTQIELSEITKQQPITVNQVSEVQSLAVEQHDNLQEIPVSPDVKFLRGKDGVSPAIEVEEVMGGFNVTITDKEHTETIFIASGGEVSEEQIIEAVNAYLAENPVQSGATAEQVEQIEQNKANIATLAEDKLDASAVSEWAKQPQKPIYTALEVGALPDTTEIPTVPEKVSAFENDAGYITEVPEVDLSGYLTEESDPTVPAWAKAATKPSYTAAEVGADASGEAAKALEGAKAYTDQQIAAIPTPDVSGQINTHNVATDAHNDIRLFISELTARVNALADSDDTTLDQMSEIVAYIKDNRELVEQVTTEKVSVADVIDNLTTNVGNKPLSAAQGVALKQMVDTIDIPSNVSAFANDAGYLTEHQSLEAYALKTELPTVPTTEETVAAVNAARITETWTFTLEDGTEVTKTVVLA